MAVPVDTLWYQTFILTFTLQHLRELASDAKAIPNMFLPLTNLSWRPLWPGRALKSFCVTGKAALSFLT